MVFTCYLCGDEWCFTSFFCDKCQMIRKLIFLYGINNVVDILEENLMVELVEPDLSDESYQKKPDLYSKVLQENINKEI